MNIELTHSLEIALAEAQSYAINAWHSEITPLHVLKALLESSDGVAKRLCGSSARVAKINRLLQEKIDHLPKLSHQSDRPTISESLRQVLTAAYPLAKYYNDQYVSSEIFLLAALSMPNEAGDLLKQAGLSQHELTHAIKNLRGGENVNQKNAETQYQALEKYTSDLTALAEKGKLDPVIGRETEIEQTIQILQRRQKNNPALIGPPGVGKTAIVEGLAQRIVAGEVPQSIKNKKVLSLDVTSLVAGAKYRGEFEERLQAVLNTIAKNPEQFILFVDEFHMLVGAGNQEGSIDASNILKPALARGLLHCIGATTLDEYRERIEKDGALDRRFVRVSVNEPDEVSTLAILRGLKSRYEIHHGVAITNNAIVSAVKLSNRYITHRFQPDKSIDLIDEAASQVRITMDSTPAPIVALRSKLTHLQIEVETLRKENDPTATKRIEELQQEIQKIEAERDQLEATWKGEKAKLDEEKELKASLDQARFSLEKAMRSTEFARMSELRYGTIPELEKKLQTIREAREKSIENQLIPSRVTEKEIAQVVSKKTKIPVSEMMADERQKFSQLETLLQTQVIGQTEVIASISDTIRRARAGLSDPDRPIGSFIFCGPTGVGKTQLCLALGNTLFNSQNAIIRFDMSEFMEKHAVARLIGAPPGYIGYEKGGELTERVRQNPYSIILLDEIEKAHPEVMNLLLQILDHGRLTDGQGHLVNFRNTLIIMTSNLGSELIQTLAPKEDYQTLKSTVKDLVSQHFKPEFINRLDEIAVFHPLELTHLKKIVTIQIEALKERLKLQGFTLSVTEKALEVLAERGFDPVYGARPLKRVIQEVLANPLAKGILSKVYSSVKPIQVDYQAHQFVIS